MGHCVSLFVSFEGAQSFSSLKWFRLLACARLSLLHSFSGPACHFGLFAPDLNAVLPKSILPVSAGRPLPCFVRDDTAVGLPCFVLLSVSFFSQLGLNSLAYPHRHSLIPFPSGGPGDIET